MLPRGAELLVFLRASSRLYMPNIISRKTAQNDKDPFASSDNPNARAYDKKADRKFRQNYDSINWGRSKERRSACCPSLP
jgi:hypothetical protein